MSMRSSTQVFKLSTLGGLLLAAALPPLTARAALGEPEASVASDVQQLKASVRSTSVSSYRVHEIQTSTGTVIREFSVPGGNVFAVAWTGPSMPNLRQTLGQYFDAYTSAAKTQRSGHTHVRVEQSDLIVQSNGHMRAYSGRAYLPQGLPAGIALSEIR